LEEGKNPENLTLGKSYCILIIYLIYKVLKKRKKEERREEEEKGL